MLTKIEEFYEKQTEPNKSCFLALRGLILNFSPDIQELVKYGLPFYYYKKKPFCYIWKDKKTNEPYIGMHKGFLIEHPSLIKGNRTRIKILPVPPLEDISKTTLYDVFKLALEHY